MRTLRLPSVFPGNAVKSCALAVSPVSGDLYVLQRGERRNTIFRLDQGQEPARKLGGYCKRIWFGPIAVTQKDQLLICTQGCVHVHTRDGTEIACWKTYEKDCRRYYLRRSSPKRAADLLSVDSQNNCINVGFMQHDLPGSSVVWRRYSMAALNGELIDHDVQPFDNDWRRMEVKGRVNIELVAERTKLLDLSGVISVYPLALPCDSHKHLLISQFGLTTIDDAVSPQPRAVCFDARNHLVYIQSGSVSIDVFEF